MLLTRLCTLLCDIDPSYAWWGCSELWATYTFTWVLTQVSMRIIGKGRDMWVLKGERAWSRKSWHNESYIYQ
jgi:hypothetical protein